MTEDEMRQALFGVTEPVGKKPDEATKQESRPRKQANRFAPNLIVTLRVGNEFEGQTEPFIYEAETLSTLQAELDAVKLARKKYRYINVISVKPV
ncbi:hypothetical protein N032_28140 (plasmid) [Pseudomonas syringae pv. pisi str. PP1]|uniref:hypothetical protein n=1 Tax=Pseudomonas syringae TaxID=317 RepID=UPI0004635302|nr:hypothetical protein [Pseudomonas syringae]AZG89423.1 hypothetical protein N032_28140 [Pseudomonas syringae pv. pisi str. PP1]